MPKSNIDTLVTVFGGSGFVGRHVVRALARRGYRIRAAVRRPDLAGHLQPLGVVGQIHAVQANVRYPESVAAALRDAEIAINLVGILAESRRQGFAAVQAEGAAHIAQAAAATGTRVIHVSAIGADPQSPSSYGRSKAEGESRVLDASPAANIFRPSIVFGPEDDFFNRFAAMARLSPALPLIGGGRTRFQPVFVGDVAEAVALAADGKVRPGVAFELGGPQVKTFKELMEFTLSVIGRRRLLLPIPFGAARSIAWWQEVFGTGLLTRDQVRLLERDNVVSDAAKADHRTLDGLGIVPTSLESVVPHYLWRFRKRGQFQGHMA